jgi:hypothetical protein
MAHERTAITFRPKRQWKPKRRDRNPRRRLKRRQWYRKNRRQIALKRKRRHKQLRNNPTYKRWQAKKRKERTKRKFRRASVVYDEFMVPVHPDLDRPDDGTPDNPCPAENVPDIWFIFSEKPDTIDVDMGYVCDYDPDTEEFLIYDIDDSEFKVVGLDDFIEHAGFLEEEDWDNFLVLLDRVYEQDLSLDQQEYLDMDLDSIARRVAAAHIEKQAFNKENPSDLLNQIVKVLDKASRQADGKGKKGLMDATSRVKGIAKPVQEAWSQRNEE